ncbi:hypothetical protein JTB14_002850 [Gonioctena quinquepunctata]|nr:hypothetical protein JTB14_002850 [Gonioctena quinquepunctata]
MNLINCYLKRQPYNREIYDILLQEDVSEEDLMVEIDSCEGYDKKFIDLKITYGNRQKHVDLGFDEDDRRSRASLAVSKSTLGPEDHPLWPQEDIVCDEEVINEERKKTLVKVSAVINSRSDYWHLNYFSKINGTLRMMAWIERFTFNSKRPTVKRQGSLSATEVENAEKFIYKIVQQECFGDGNHKKINTLNHFKDENGLIRLKTRF